MPTILLVDDEERFVKILHSNLERCGYQCTDVFNGRDAMRLLRENRFDLMLLDVELPDMTGCDLLEWLKKSQISTTAVMLTGVSTVETAVNAMKLGAYDFLGKPINHEALLKTLAKALQHHHLTAELAASEKRFQILADASWEGIVIHDNGRLLEANNQFFAMFGYDPADLADGSFLEKILSPASLAIISNHIANSSFDSTQLIGRRKDGSEFPIESSSQAIVYRERQVRVCAIRDLSERVRAEEEKLNLQSKLSKANTLHALGLMAGAVAHDLNNILTGVVSYPELLLSQLRESDPFYKELKKIQSAGKRAAAVVSDLVMLARSGSPSTCVENINDIILSHLSSIEHCERLARYPGVRIQTHLHQNLANVACSHPHLHKIFLNLIGNALEAVNSQGLIRIATENCIFTNPAATQPLNGSDPEQYVKITISDNGPGIAPDDIDHIFDPFYTTKRMGKSGTGLGLTIVWNTVQEHKGWIEVRNNNPGAAFEIYLPASADPSISAVTKPGIDQFQGSGEKILLIDDLPEQNETMGKMLTAMGYTPYAVTSGEAGIAFVKSQSVDLVLLDMIMGEGLNGRQTYEQILKIRPDQKAIIISGYSRNEEILKAKALGISHFLEKPITMHKISRAIRQALAGQ